MCPPFISNCANEMHVRAILILLFLISCKYDSTSPSGGAKNITLINLVVDNRSSSASYPNSSLSPEIVLSFSEPIDHQSAQDNILMNGGSVPLNYSFTNRDSTIVIHVTNPLKYFSVYSFQIQPSL